VVKSCFGETGLTMGNLIDQCWERQNRCLLLRCLGQEMDSSERDEMEIVPFAFKKREAYVSCLKPCNQ